MFAPRSHVLVVVFSISKSDMMFIHIYDLKTQRGSSLITNHCRLASLKGIQAIVMRALKGKPHQLLTWKQRLTVSAR